MIHSTPAFDPEPKFTRARMRSHYLAPHHQRVKEAWDSYCAVVDRCEELGTWNAEWLENAMQGVRQAEVDLAAAIARWDAAPVAVDVSIVQLQEVAA